MATGHKTGGGSRKGKPNRATADVRAAVAMLAQNLAPELEQWIRKGAKKQPLLAARVAANIFEYHIPKLSRTELTGEGGKPLEVNIVRYSATQPVGSAPVPAAAVERT